MTTLEILTRLGACEDARAWAAKHPDPRRAWQRCERGDWMLWIAARLDVDRRAIVWAACQCARIWSGSSAQPRMGPPSYAVHLA